MRGCHLLQGKRRQQWKSDHYAQGDDDERREIAPGWTFLPKQKQQTQAKYAGDRGARNSQEYRIELLYGHTGCWQ